MTLSFDGLEDSFDNDAAERMLDLAVSRITHTSEVIRKSIYDFDLETPEGIEKLMSLIPIMDPEILKDIMAEIWPGYPSDIDARRHRMEIKGYLKDFMETYDEEDSVEQTENTAQEPEPAVAGTDPTSPTPPTGSSKQEDAAPAPDAEPGQVPA